MPGMSQRAKILQRMRGPGKRNVRFPELLSLAEYYAFSTTFKGADCILRHPMLTRHVFINKPHGGRDFVRPHDIDRFVDALDELEEQGAIELPAGSDDETVEREENR
jgi:hypothetical protein